MAAVVQRVATGIKGKWVSITCELRFHEIATESNGKVEATWIKREFIFDGRNNFQGRHTTYDDSLCQSPHFEYYFRGRLEWRGPHETAPTAQKVDFIMDEEFSITPRSRVFIEQMNKLPSGACGDKKWELNVAQDVLRRPCVLLNTKQGEVVKDFDLIYLSYEGMFLFMGAKQNMDQRFSKDEEHRPKGGLQVPLVRAHYLNPWNYWK
ncbi:MAG: hypothetical protein HYV97_05260 [Bdellovibrio sp.]|nr:hypothetical protein [Bdellovibrio sp.]